MRIPLDYYRILGLPLQATADQLKQARSDRALQLPRREYSEAAIAVRRQLIEQAFSVLSDPDQRRAYDEQLLATSYDLEGDVEQFPTIEIDDRQLVGALLILHELGEYELVLKLGRPYLSSGTAPLKDGRYGDPRLVLSDIVLTLALACLELGREQWQQGQYENAAEALLTGQDLLLRENLFTGVRGEIQADLYKLRPYRVLELLALSDEETNFSRAELQSNRAQGLQILKEMLRDRGGIDGSSNDQSGLSTDDFLRFIQQLRGYLTAEEQQALFEEEARRPSAVATYLAVYALLARGFADQQPALIRRAKLMLLRLGSRQDVHLEQAVCALLLGQTEEASRVLELSQEYEPLAFIREQSQGSPDLLPGLCLYAERWLQDEVFPHFRDLAKRSASLKDYFANEQVQEYLEELPIESEVASDWSFAQRGIQNDLTSYSSSFAVRNGRSRQSRSNARYRSDETIHASDTASGFSMRNVDRSATATLNPSDSMIAPAERLSRSDSTRSRAVVVEPAFEGEPPRSHPRENGAARNGHSAKRSRSKLASPDGHPASNGRSARNKRKFGLPVLAFGIVAAGLLGFVLIRSLKSITKPSLTETTDALSVQLDRPVVSLQAPSATDALTGDMNPTTAQKVIEAWFAAKKAAMGSTHDVEKLNQILVDPRLSEWRKNVADSKQDNLRIEYDQSVQVNNVETSPSDPNQAVVTAKVTEVRKYFQADKPMDTQTDRDMQVRYNLVRQNNQWRIKDWK